jgi:hypothetical protein
LATKMVRISLSISSCSRIAACLASSICNRMPTRSNPRDIACSPTFAPLRNEAKRRSIRSTAAVPVQSARGCGEPRARPGRASRVGGKARRKPAPGRPPATALSPWICSALASSCYRGRGRGRGHGHGRDHDRVLSLCHRHSCAAHMRGAGGLAQGRWRQGQCGAARVRLRASQCSIDHRHISVGPQRQSAAIHIRQPQSNT